MAVHYRFYTIYNELTKKKRKEGIAISKYIAFNKPLLRYHLRGLEPNPFYELI